MRRILFTAALALAAMTPATASAQACTDATAMTGYMPYYQGCRGSFSGNINGSASEMNYLASQFGYTWFYQGKSDNGGFGPFKSNPEATTGTLTFDAPVYGLFVVGIKASNQYS